MSLSDKHLLNSPSSLVVDSLSGLCAINSGLKFDATNKGGFLHLLIRQAGSKRDLLFLVVYQANPDRSKVALICGGGSGHEPAHAGFVGACLSLLATAYLSLTINYISHM